MHILTRINRIEWKINNGLPLNDYDIEEIMEIFSEVKNMLQNQ
ncbi:hypothetical protein [Providencia rettgeri]|nr:hypothetical protein [Providencia rettgeri]